MTHRQWTPMSYDCPTTCCLLLPISWA